MTSAAIYEILDGLSEKHIPEGRHKFLHVEPREMWRDLMIELLESKAIPMKVSMLSKCAVNWEAILTQRLSIQN